MISIPRYRLEARLPEWGWVVISVHLTQSALEGAFLDARQDCEYELCGMELDDIPNTSKVLYSERR